jgi:triacylglycerol lipase
MEGRWAVRWWPTVRREVDDLIPLASPNHGISAADLCADSGNCWPAVWQMRPGANFIRALNSMEETPGEVSFTDIYSLTDELVEPSSTVPLVGGANTANIAVQDVCPRVVHHGGLLDDSVVYALVIDAMTHRGPADPNRLDRVRVCTATFMPGVSAADAVEGNATLYSAAAQAFAQHPGVTAEPPLAPYARGS